MPISDSATKQEFKTLIKYDHGMVVDRPHIFSFMRTTETVVKIEFAVDDKKGKPVIKKQIVELEDLSDGKNADMSKCK